MPELSAEDQKLLTLARAARARVGARQGAAVRDGDGRTYTGVTVALPSLALSALQQAVAAAVAAGARTLEAAAVVGPSEDGVSSAGDGGVPSAGDGGVPADEAGRAAVRDLAPGVPVYLAGPDGAPLASVVA